MNTIKSPFELSPSSLLKRSLVVLLTVAALSFGCGDDGDRADAGGDADAAGDTAGDATGDTVGDVPDDSDAPPDPDADASSDADSDADDTVEQDVDTDADADTSTTPPELVTVDEAFALVDPFIGSGGVGFGYASLTPAAQLPLGFVKLGPDTTFGGAHAAQNHFSGYYYTDPHTRGFSHVRLVGTGAADLGNLRVLPLAALDDRDPWLRFTTLDKESEEARPGWYRTSLPDEGVTAEFTTSWFSAIHRYSFSGGGAFLQIDPASAITDSGVENAEIAFVDGRVVGHVDFRGSFTGRARGFTLHFDIVADPAPTTVSAWDEEGAREGDEAAGALAGLVLDFGDASDVELRVGLSLIDGDAARANRESELDDRSFDDVATAAADLWKQRLGTVRLAGGTEREQTMFYTALYNAYRMPTRLSEPDGRYRGNDAEVHTVEEGLYVSDLSLWDTYRTLHPWYSLTDHDAQRDSLRSLLRMAEQGDRGFPKWPSMLGDTGSMIGTSADVLFGDAATKGITGIDWQYALDALMASNYGVLEDPPGPRGRPGIADYVEFGYLPADRHGSSVSITAEYSWNDFALANLARVVGDDELAAVLDARARSYMNLRHPTRNLLWPRNADGSFIEDWNDRTIVMGSGHYTEGSTWHWSFYFWHAPDAMIDAIGNDGIRDLLDNLFDRSSLAEPGRPNNTLPGSYYWHGNEPTIHIPYIYSTIGDPNRASHWVREIQERLYDDTPAGLPGNDDGGTMSTWYLFSALGLYPVAGSDLYYLTAPLFERAEIDLPDGTVLTIEAPGASHETRTMTAISVDGEPLPTFDSDATIRHADLQGATLRFDLE